MFYITHNYLAYLKFNIQIQNGLEIYTNPNSLKGI